MPTIYCMCFPPVSKNVEDTDCFPNPGTFQQPDVSNGQVEASILTPKYQRYPVANMICKVMPHSTLALRQSEYDR